MQPSNHRTRQPGWRRTIRPDGSIPTIPSPCNRPSTLVRVLSPSGLPWSGVSRDALREAVLRRRGTSEPHPPRNSCHRRVTGVVRDAMRGNGIGGAGFGHPRRLAQPRDRPEPRHHKHHPKPASAAHQAARRAISWSPQLSGCDVPQRPLSRRNALGRWTLPPRAPGVSHRAAAALERPCPGAAFLDANRHLPYRIILLPSQESRGSVVDRVCRRRSPAVSG